MARRRPEIGSLLSPKEAEYLTLVAAGLSTKEIVRRYTEAGRKLGPDSVNEAIESARIKLGAGSRFQAAARFVGRDVPPPLGAKPDAMGADSQGGILDNRGAADVGGVREDRATFYGETDNRIEAAIERIVDQPMVRLALVAHCALLILAVIALAQPSSRFFTLVGNFVAPAFSWRENRHD